MEGGKRGREGERGDAGGGVLNAVGRQVVFWLPGGSSLGAGRTEQVCQYYFFHLILLLRLLLRLLLLLLLVVSTAVAVAVAAAAMAVAAVATVVAVVTSGAPTAAMVATAAAATAAATAAVPDRRRNRCVGAID